MNVTYKKGSTWSLKVNVIQNPRDPLKGRTERTEKNRAPEIDASMAVSGLIQMTGLHSRDARIVLDSMAREVERKGEDLIAWADTLAKSWQLLEESAQGLSTTGAPQNSLAKAITKTQTAGLGSKNSDPRKSYGR